MSDPILIVLVRAIHILSGVSWAGATFVLASVILPLSVRHADDGAGRWLGMAARKLGPMSGGAAWATVLSGMYLFAALHPHDDSAGAAVLKAGAAAALLALAMGIVVGRPAGMKLAQWQQGSSAAASQGELAALRRRATIASRATAALLGLSVLSMAVFRYIAA